MDNRQTIPSKKAGIRFSLSRKLRSRRFWLMIVLVVLSLIFFETPASGQAECFDNCQSHLAGCLQTAHGDAAAETRCQDQYDECGDRCIGGIYP
jgi:hypothetical protein